MIGMMVADTVTQEEDPQMITLEEAPVLDPLPLPVSPRQCHPDQLWM